MTVLPAAPVGRIDADHDEVVKVPGGIWPAMLVANVVGFAIAPVAGVDAPLIVVRPLDVTLPATKVPPLIVYDVDRFLYPRMLMTPSAKLGNVWVRVGNVTVKLCPAVTNCGADALTVMSTACGPKLLVHCTAGKVCVDVTMGGPVARAAMGSRLVPAAIKAIARKVVRRGNGGRRVRNPV